jgi:hypothetical protein
MAHPTAALLWAACRLTPSIDDVRAAVDAGADLDAAANLAVAQRVSPLLWRALGAAGLAESGEDWAAVLKRDAARCHAQSRLLLPRIGALALEPLAAAGLEPLVIKGGELAQRYPDPGLRPMDDIDLVLPTHQVDEGAAALSAAGWAWHETPARQRHEVQFTHASLPGLHVDLHRSLGTWRNRSNRLTTDELWSARQPTTLYDAPAFVLPTELNFVMLAAHAGKPWHTFDRLIWVVDLAIVAANDIDWAEVGRRAQAARCEAAVAVGLSQAARIGVESPAELRRIDGSWRAHALKPLLSPDWPAMSHSREQRAIVRYALVDERATRAKLIASELTSKTLWSAPRRTYWLAKRTVRQIAERRRERLS